LPDDAEHELLTSVGMHLYSAPVNMDALADAVVRIGEAAMALGLQLPALEVNSLLADTHGAEALDGVVAWADVAQNAGYQGDPSPIEWRN
jgi:hypothetical protein